MKGPAHLDVGFRSGVVNFMARVEAGPEWTVVEVPFTKLAPTGRAPEGAQVDRERRAGLRRDDAADASAVDAPIGGDFAFEIDDVVFYGTTTGRLEPVASGPSGGYGVVPFTKLSVSSVRPAGAISAPIPNVTGIAPALPDAVRFEAIPSAAGDMLWARITLREAPHDRWIGINLALDTDGDPANGVAVVGHEQGVQVRSARDGVVLPRRRRLPGLHRRRGRRPGGGRADRRRAAEHGCDLRSIANGARSSWACRAICSGQPPQKFVWSVRSARH